MENNKDYHIHSNYLFGYNRTEPSKEWVESQKPNFEEILKQHKPVKKSLVKKPIFWIAAATFAALVTVSVFLFLPVAKKEHALQRVKAMDSFLVQDNFKNITIPIIQEDWNPKESKIIVAKSGLTFTLPENGIIDKNGKTIQENVQIKYREITSAAEMVVSGIANSNEYAAQNAGIFEIHAYKNGEKLFLAPGKTIGISQPTYANNDYLAFQLNESNGNWVNQIDETAMQTISKTDYTTKDSSIENSIPEIDNSKLPIAKLKNFNKAISIPPPRIQNPQHPSFELDENMKSRFPELVPYMNIIFEVKPGQGYRNDREIWEKIEFAKTAVANEYKVTLWLNQKPEHYIVYPVFRSGSDYKAALNSYNQKLSELGFSSVSELRNSQFQQQTLDHALHKTQDKSDGQRFKKKYSISSFGIWSLLKKSDIQTKAKTISIAVPTKFEGKYLFVVDTKKNSVQKVKVKNGNLHCKITGNELLLHINKENNTLFYEQVNKENRVSINNQVVVKSITDLEKLLSQKQKS